MKFFLMWLTMLSVCAAMISTWDHPTMELWKFFEVLGLIFAILYAGTPKEKP